MKHSREELATILRDELGERRYIRFVRQLYRARADGLVAFWQSRVLDKLESKLGLVLPQYAAALAGLLPVLPPNPTLAEHELPSWIAIEQFEYGAPTQAWGTAGAWRWYFRARHESWSLGAERNANELPVGDFEDGSDTFFVSEDFGVEAFDASYMTLDEARYFIVRELSRLRARPDSGI